MKKYSIKEKECVYQVIWNIEYHSFEEDFFSKYNIPYTERKITNKDFMSLKTKEWNKIINEKYGLEYCVGEEKSYKCIINIKNEKKYNLIKLKYSEKISELYEKLYGRF